MHLASKFEEVSLEALTEHAFTIRDQEGRQHSFPYGDIRFMNVARVGASDRCKTVIDLVMDTWKNHSGRLRVVLNPYYPMRLLPASPSSSQAMMSVIYTFQRESGNMVRPLDTMSNEPRTFENLEAFEAATYQ